CTRPDVPLSNRCYGSDAGEQTLHTHRARTGYFAPSGGRSRQPTDRRRAWRLRRHGAQSYVEYLRQAGSDNPRGSHPGRGPTARTAEPRCKRAPRTAYPTPYASGTGPLAGDAAGTRRPAQAERWRDAQPDRG